MKTVFGERTDDFFVLDDRTRPSIQQQQRHCIWIFRPLMDEMDIDAVDVGLELVESIQAFLLNTPVVLVPPIFDKALEIREIRAVVPSRVRKLVREAGLCQPPFQFSQQSIRDLNFEWDDRSWFCRSLCVSGIDKRENGNQYYTR